MQVSEQSGAHRRHLQSDMFTGELNVLSGVADSSAYAAAEKSELIEIEREDCRAWWRLTASSAIFFLRAFICGRLEN